MGVKRALGKDSEDEKIYIEQEEEEPMKKKPNIGDNGD